MQVIKSAQEGEVMTAPAARPGHANGLCHAGRGLLRSICDFVFEVADRMSEAATAISIFATADQ